MKSRDSSMLQTLTHKTRSTAPHACTNRGRTCVRASALGAPPRCVHRAKRRADGERFDPSRDKEYPARGSGRTFRSGKKIYDNVQIHPKRSAARGSQNSKMYSKNSKRIRIHTFLIDFGSQNSFANDAARVRRCERGVEA